EVVRTSAEEHDLPPRAVERERVFVACRRTCPNLLLPHRRLHRDERQRYRRAREIQPVLTSAPRGRRLCVREPPRRLLAGLTRRGLLGRRRRRLGIASIHLAAARDRKQHPEMRDEALPPYRAHQRAFAWTGKLVIWKRLPFRYGFAFAVSLK